MTYATLAEAEAAYKVYRSETTKTYYWSFRRWAKNTGASWPGKLEKQKQTYRCGRCGDVKTLVTGGMFCEDCALYLEYHPS